MSMINFLKERWLSFLFLFCAFVFAALVYRLDHNFSIRDSNAVYILMGWGFLFIAWFAADAYTLKSRERKFRDFCRLNGTSEEAGDFFYPMDRENARLVRELASEYEKYRAEIETKSSEEMEFITKWLHDAKVPIAAARLILESQEDKLPVDFYKNIHSEIFSIEESILQVFYEMKSNRFFDDYRIAAVGTKKLISQALKGYSSFFSYKRLGISVEGADFEVLTDEKWSSYILSQLISNAVKYTPEGGRIEILTEKSGNQTLISVRNEGKGIPPQDIGRIFNKGFTASESREGAKATGYGLYLSKKLGDLLGHSLTAESNPNEYALFRLTFYDHDSLYGTSSPNLPSKLTANICQCDENVRNGSEV